MRAEPGEHVVEGEVVLGSDAPDFDDALLQVRLIDATYSDAPSAPIGETIRERVSHRQGTESRWPFRLNVPRPAPNARYAATAHVSLTGNEEIVVGDFLSMQSYPVDPWSDADQASPIRIQVRPVR